MGLGVILGACGTDGASEGCQTDLDCKGERICDATRRRCVDPNATGSGAGGMGGDGQGASSSSGSSGGEGGGGAGGVTPVDLGDGWLSINLGLSEVLGGYATRSDDAFELFGGGGDVWGTSDHAQVVYREVTGDFDLMVEVDAYEPIDGLPETAKAILLFKARGDGQSAPTSDGAGVFQSLNHDYGDFWYWRSAAGDDIMFDPATPELNATLPVQLRITRVGDTFSTYVRSQFGETWVKHNDDHVEALAADGFVGFGATSVNDELLHVSFSHVNLGDNSGTGGMGGGGAGGAGGMGAGGAGGMGAGGMGGGVPVVNNLVVTSTDHHEATIQFDTAVPTTVTVEYDIDKWAKVAADPVLSTTHAVTMGQLLSGASHDYQITITDAAMTSSTGILRTVSTTPYTSSGLPAGWASQDIGLVSTLLPGSVVYDATELGGLFAVKGTGTDVFFDADSFHYVSHPVTGDFTFTLRVESYNGYLHMWTKAMTMFRVDMTPGSQMFNQSINYIDNDYYYYRPVADMLHVLVSDTQFQTAIGAGVWARLQRVGDTFHVFYSQDGVSWTEHVAGGTVVPLPTTGTVGFGVCSKSNDHLSEIVYSNVSVTMP